MGIKPSPISKSVKNVLDTIQAKSMAIILIDFVLFFKVFTSISIYKVSDKLIINIANIYYSLI